MDHELAQELKAAGYPQGSSVWLYTGDGLYQPRMYKGQFHGNETDAPTLEELIEACGEIVLWPFQGTWCAGKPNDEGLGGRGITYYDEYPVHLANGRTPFEAVARLWLALNPKK
jgi:hypothetical protein